MKNWVAPGKTVTIAAPYNVDSGEGVLVGALFGIAAGDADAAETVDVTVEGIFDIAKNAASVFTVGQQVKFNSVDKKAHSNADEDSNSGGAVTIGVAVAAAGVGAASVRVRLGAPVV
jgi:predicted RecA/RadA family phage recombinase